MDERIPFKNLHSRDYSGHKKKLHSVAWNCIGTKLASGSFDQTARIWHIEQHGHLILCFYEHPSPLYASTSSVEGIFKDTIRKNHFSYGKVVKAVKGDSSSHEYDYKVDPDKARKALNQLDQQLQSLSTKQISTPKVRVSDVKLTKEQAEDIEEFGISKSFLMSLTAGLVLFTMFYNVLFYTVIKPSVDGS